MSEQGWITAAGQSLHYRAWGAVNEAPVILVHGLSGFSYDWTAIASELALDHRVVAVDLRGFGESARSADGAYALPDFCADLDAVAEELDFDHFSVVGHSLGGRIGLYYAATRPTAVDSLALIDAVPEMNPDGSRVVRERLASSPESYETIDAAATALHPQFSRVPLADFVARLHDYLAVGDDGLLRMKRDRAFVTRMPGQYVAPADTPNRTFWELASDVRAPVVLVRGTRSTMVTPELADRLRSEIPSLEIVELDASHNVPADAPVELASTLRRFLSKKRSHA